MKRCFWLLLLAACSSPPQQPGLEDDRGGVFLSGMNSEMPDVVLERAGHTLARISVAGLQLGTVEQVSDEVNYDPWPLVQDPLGTYKPPAGLSFDGARQISLKSRSSERLELELGYGGGLGASLIIEKAGGGKLSLPMEARRIRLGGLFQAAPGGRPHRGLLRSGRRARRCESAGKAPGHADRAGPGAGKRQQRGPHSGAPSSGHPGLGDLRGQLSTGHVRGGGGKAGGHRDHLWHGHLFGKRGWCSICFRRRIPSICSSPIMKSPAIRSRPPPWALGPWLWRDENDSQQQVADDVNTMRQLDLAASAIWIDRPYASGVNSFDFDPVKFPGPTAMIKEIHDLGFRLALWHTPYIDEKDPATAALLDEAKSQGYFPPRTGIVANNWSAPLDFNQSGGLSVVAGAYSPLRAAGHRGIQAGLRRRRGTGIFRDAQRLAISRRL
jgi:hypothetical protein